jgi:hypothetical protein
MTQLRVWAGCQRRTYNGAAVPARACARRPMGKQSRALNRPLSDKLHLFALSAETPALCGSGISREQLRDHRRPPSPRLAGRHRKQELKRVWLSCTIEVNRVSVLISSSWQRKPLMKSSLSTAAVLAPCRRHGTYVGG